MWEVATVCPNVTYSNELNTVPHVEQSRVLPPAAFCTPSPVSSPHGKLTTDVESSDPEGPAPGNEEGAVHPTRHLCTCDFPAAHRQLSVDVNYSSSYKCYFLYNPLKLEAGNKLPVMSQVVMLLLRH